MDFVVVHPEQQSGGFPNGYLDVSDMFRDMPEEGRTPLECMLYLERNYKKLDLGGLIDEAGFQSGMGPGNRFVLYCTDTGREKHCCLAYVLHYVLSVHAGEEMAAEQMPRYFAEDFDGSALGLTVCTAEYGERFPFASTLHALYYAYVKVFWSELSVDIGKKKKLLATIQNQETTCSQLAELFVSGRKGLHENSRRELSLLPVMAQFLFSIAQWRYHTNSLFRHQVKRFGYFMYISPCTVFGTGIGSEAFCGKNIYGWVLTILHWEEKKGYLPLDFYERMYVCSTEGIAKQPLFDGLRLVYDALQSAKLWNVVEKETARSLFPNTANTSVLRRRRLLKKRRCRSPARPRTAWCTVVSSSSSSSSEEEEEKDGTARTSKQSRKRR